MINGYIVHYYIGNKKSNPYKLWIAAHNSEQAEHLCLVQAGHRHGYGFKINITGVETENGTKIKTDDNSKVNEVKSRVTPQLTREELILSIMEANQIASQSLKRIGKRHKISFLKKLIRRLI